MPGIRRDGNDQLILLRINSVSQSADCRTIAPWDDAGEFVLILRQPPAGREVTYRILVDQIPPPAEAGTVHVVLRLSIPIFAQPTTPAVPHIRFHIEKENGQLVLVGVNNGLRHEAIRDIALRTSDGRELKGRTRARRPYILAGNKRGAGEMVGQGIVAAGEQSPCD